MDENTVKPLFFFREVKNSQRQVKWKLSHVAQFRVCRKKTLNLSPRRLIDFQSFTANNKV